MEVHYNRDNVQGDMLYDVEYSNRDYDKSGRVRGYMRVVLMWQVHLNIMNKPFDPRAIIINKCKLL